MAAWDALPDAVAPKASWESLPTVGTEKYQFSPEAIKRYQNEPTATLTYVPGKTALMAMPKFEQDPSTDAKGKSLQRSLDNGDKINDVPLIVLDNDGNVIHADGRHRIQKAMESGLDQIPVAVIGLKPGVNTIKGPQGEMKLSDFGVKPIQTPAQKINDDSHNVVRGVADAIGNLATTTIATPVAGLAGLAAAGAGAVMPGPQGQAADWGAQTVQKVLGAVPEPSTPIGKAITNTIAYPFEKLAQGANAAGEKVTDATGSPLAGAAVNTAIQALPMAVSKVASKVAPGGELPSTKAARLTKEAQNTNRDAIISELHDSGYALPLSQTNPTMPNKAMEGFAGKIKGLQDYSLHNQEVTNNLVRSEFGIPTDVPLSSDWFRQFRRTEGDKYDLARNTGNVQLTSPFRTAVDDAVSRFKSVAQNTPELQSAPGRDVLRVKRVLDNKPTLDASAMVDLVNQFREKANSLYDNKLPSAGRAYKDIANAMEAELEDHLTRTNQPPDLVQNVRDARRNIAKAHNVEDALTAGGDVDARVLGKQWKDGQGVPFQGDLLTVAKLGAEYPKVAQLPRKIGGVPMSPLDFAGSALAKMALSGGATAAAAGGAAAAGFPAAAALAIPFSRPLVRNALATRIMQSLGAPNYGPFLKNHLLAMQEQPLVAATETAQGQRNALNGN